MNTDEERHLAPLKGQHLRLFRGGGGGSSGQDGHFTLLISLPQPVG